MTQKKTVRYSVKDLYENKSAKVPSGSWIQTKSKDGSINFNVFVPNVQAGIKINYQTGKTTIN
jgi:DNA-entry nuclease